MAGPIATLSGSMSINLAATVTKTDALVGNTTLSPGLAVSEGFTQSATPPSGSRQANQYKYFTVTVAASGTTTLDLIAASANVLGNTAATFASISGFAFLLPTTTQLPALGLSVQSSGVTVGDAATTGNALFLTDAAAMTFELKPGRCISMLDCGTATIVVDSTHKDVKFVNNDATNAATIVVILMGKDS